MAFVDKFMGDPFLNVTQRVDKNGLFDDILLVQIMLKFLFTESPPLSRINPAKGPITVNGIFAQDTPLLIAAFQKQIQKRQKPQGFLNKAIGVDAQKSRFTIVQMNLLIGS